MKATLCVATHDGNDPIEADVHLSAIPQIGTTLAMWDDGAPNHFGCQQTDHFPVVVDVVMSVYWPDDIKVYLRFDGFDLDEIRRVMDCARRGVTP